MAEGGALQAGRLWGQGLRLQLKGVTKGASSQAVERLDSNPAEDFGEMSGSQYKGDDDDINRDIFTQQPQLIKAYT